MIADMTSTKTFSPRPADIERRWYVVDADGAVLGRLASEVAKILRGKHKPIFAPHADTGDHVIVVNARGVRLTGGKENTKVYYRHSGYPGGLTEVGYARLLAERPVLAVEKAIRGMLPKNRLGRQVLRKLAVYEGPEHPHQAQRPAALALGEVPRWEGLPRPAAKPAPAPRRRSAASKAGSKTASRTRAGAKAATGRGSKAKTASKSGPAARSATGKTKPKTKTQTKAKTKTTSASRRRPKAPEGSGEQE
jgi:large subunit ribosomal protein L13